MIKSCVHFLPNAINQQILCSLLRAKKGISTSLGKPYGFPPLTTLQYAFPMRNPCLSYGFYPLVHAHTPGTGSLKRCTNLGVSRLSTYLPTVNSLRVRLRKSLCDNYEPVIDSSFVTANKRFTRLVVSVFTPLPCDELLRHCH